MVNRDSVDKAKDIEATQVNNNNNNNRLHKQQQQQLLSNSSSKTMLAQHEEIVLNNKSRNNMTYCCKKRWILFLSMTITLLISAYLVVTLTVSLLDNEDQCFQSSPFQQPSYNLFSTKTTYSTSYKYLNSSHHYDRNSVQLPNIFSKVESLKTLNDRLTSRESGCKVRQLHYFGRHAARYPSEKNIKQITQLLNDVQTRIDLSMFTLNNSNNNNGNKSNVCLDPLAQYKQWNNFMSPEQGNLIMKSGIDETLALALRFKSIFPQMFNGSLSKIEVGTTEELRTAQTALVFLKQIDNFSLGFCSLDQFPNDDASDKFKVDQLTSNECYKAFIKKHHKDKLQFHKRCESLHTEEFPMAYNLNLKEPNNRTKSISVSVSKKLKLARDDQLSIDETDALYKICKYETALQGSSIWCNLFSDNDLKFYEYLNDVDDYMNQAYGHPDQMRSACPVTTELMKSFKIAKGQDSSKTQPEAHFYFTHSEVLQKIIAASVDLEQDPGYAPKNILANFLAGTSPESRQWRTSLFTPFSANLAFTLYECPRSNKLTGLEDDQSASSPFKVVASLNEQPILLDGCSNHVCDLIELETDSRINKEKRCKLEDICRKNIVVT